MPKQNDAAPRSKRSIWDNRAFLMAISFLAALFTWSLVTMYWDPQANVTRSGVPVDYSYNSSLYTSLGLDIVERDEDVTVTVRFDGTSTLIGNIQTSDFIVYPNYSALKGAGETTLSLLVRITNSEYSGVTATVENPKAVTIVFDEVSEKTVPVTVEASGIELAENRTLSRTAAVPAEVTITGPTSELEQIDTVVAPVTYDGTLTDSVTLESQLEMRDVNGFLLEPEYSTLDNTAASVTLTVYEVRELPLVIDFINTPSGFDAGSLSYTLSQETLRVAGPSKTVTPLSELSVYSFDLAQQFAFDRDYTLPVELPSGLVAQDGISSVTLSFDTAGMDTRTYNVSNIRCINVPSTYEIEILTDRISDVVLYGPEEEIATLSAESIVAQLDCQSISVSAGQQTLPVSISVPASSKIFYTGSYTVECQITAK